LDLDVRLGHKICQSGSKRPFGDFANCQLD